MNYSSLNYAIFNETQLPDGAKILDIGCRDSAFLQGFAEYFPGKISYALGVDMTDKGFGNFKYKKPIELKVMDCSNGLDLPDESFDFVFSKDMFECVSNKDLLVSEIYRVLKPDGSVICVNCDWDSVVYNGENKELISKAIHAYAVTKQGWMDDLDSWIGRRMFGIFNSSGLFKSSVTVHSVVETEYSDGFFGYDFSKHIGWLSQENTGALTAGEYNEFISNLEAAAQKGDYIFVKPYYIYKGCKK